MQRCVFFEMAHEQIPRVFSQFDRYLHKETLTPARLETIWVDSNRKYSSVFLFQLAKGIRISVVYFPDSRENYELLSGILIAATGLERVEIRLQPQCPFQGYKSGRLRATP